MFLSDVLRLLRRRWLILLCGLIVTAGVAMWAGNPPPSYRATEIFVVEPPRTPTIPNQLTGLRPSVAMTAAGVARRLSSHSERARLRRAGVSGSYALAPRNSGTRQTPEYLIASVQVTVTEPDEAAAMRSLAVITEAFAHELNALQDQWNVAAEERFTISMLAEPHAERLPSSKARAIAGASMLGAICSVALAAGYDRSWRRRRSAAEATSGPRPTAAAVADLSRHALHR